MTEDESMEESSGAEEEAAAVDEMPWRLLVYTGCVCVGTMMNFTLAIPVSTLYATTLIDSGLLISAYSVGALLSLGVFRVLYGLVSIQAAYLVHASAMLLGNGALVLAAVAGRFDVALLARFVVGLEGGVMLVTNVVLVTNSTLRTRVKYLGLYQFFVGVGLVSGPALAAAGLAAGRSLGHADTAEAFASGIMCVWSVMLLVALVVKPPEEGWCSPGPSAERLLAKADDETKTDDDDAGSRRKAVLMGAGNFVRIAQRVAWEAGAIVVAEEQFGWSVVEAALFVSAFGAAQTVAQLSYGAVENGRTSSRGRQFDESAVLRLLGVAEAVGIALLFGRFKASRAASLSCFVAGSLLLYVSNCLTSAPFNNRLLPTTADREDLATTLERLVAAQAGIFFAFAAAPMYVRIALSLAGVDQTVLAAVSLTAWAVQVAVDSIAADECPSLILHSAVALCLTGLLAVAVLVPALGGTGASNVFSWHPILMGLGFFCFMTAGSLAYRPTLVVESDKRTRRRLHGALMTLAVSAALGGYAAVFAAHYNSGESQLGINETASRQAHVALGYVCLLGLVIQAFSGPLKAYLLEAQGLRRFPWHGYSGHACLLFGYAVAALGFWLHMNYTSKGGWSAALKLALTALALALTLFAALPLSGVGRSTSNGAPLADQDAAGSGATSPATSEAHLLIYD